MGAEPTKQSPDNSLVSSQPLSISSNHKIHKAGDLFEICYLQNCENYPKSPKMVVLEKDPRGSKVLERCDIVSTSEIKAGKEQLDHEEFF